MTNRPSSPVPETDPTANQGQPDEFGLVAWLEQTRLKLPLKGVECRFRVAGPLATVEVDQIFLQSHPQPLDVTYLFPLPGQAAVYRCEMIVQGRVVAAVVESVEEARAKFEKAKQEGYRAGLVESHRPNLFQLSLGNVQPRDVIVIRLALLVELERWDETVSLRIPVCPGERYVPGRPLLRSNGGAGAADDTDQVPDASRITPPRVEALHPDAACFYVGGRLSGVEVDHSSLVSPSHPIAVREGREGALLVSLPDHQTVPDRDFILRWRPVPIAPGEARAVVGRGPEGSQALVTVRGPKTPTARNRTPLSLWLLVDRSGSMSGAKWSQACRAVRRVVNELADHDLVFLTFFESDFQAFAEKPLRAAALRQDARFRSMETLGTGGGTEILPALGDTLRRVAQARAAGAQVVVLTDGQVANEAAALDTVRQHPGVRFHTVGIDTAVNDAFLEQLAARSGGRCLLVHPGEDLVEPVSALVRDLHPPEIVDLRVQGGWVSEGHAPSGLHQESSCEWLLTHPDSSAPPPVLSGRDAHGRAWATTAREIPDSDGALVRLVAKRRISHLETENRDAEALVLAKRHNLICRGAAFLAIDTASRVEVAARHLFQPSLEVHKLILMQNIPVKASEPFAHYDPQLSTMVPRGMVFESTPSPRRQRARRVESPSSRSIPPRDRTERILHAALLPWREDLQLLVQHFLVGLEQAYNLTDEEIAEFCLLLVSWIRQEEQAEDHFDEFLERLGAKGDLIRDPLEKLLAAFIAAPRP